MKKIKIYLDNCCFNRPYDDQNDIRVKMESEAKIIIQEKIKNKEWELSWSYILDYENNHNPIMERIMEIEKWKEVAVDMVYESDKILLKMNELIKNNIKPIDALHVSSAIEVNCDYFITVDKGILKKRSSIKDIVIVSPIDFIFQMMEEMK